MAGYAKVVIFGSDGKVKKYHAILEDVELSMDSEVIPGTGLFGQRRPLQSGQIKLNCSDIKEVRKRR